MRVRLSMLLVLLCAAASGCAPKDKCSGTLYYDPVNYSCRMCPKDATFKDETCVCKASYEFVDNRCVLMDGAMVEEPDAGTMPDSGAGATLASGPTCTQYCDFAKVCIGDNSLAQNALSSIVSGLHGDDTAACTSGCKSDLGSDGAGDPVVACIEMGRAKAACAGQSTQAGLSGAIGLLGDCCRPAKSNALCKSICKTLLANSLVANSVDFCN